MVQTKVGSRQYRFPHASHEHAARQGLREVTGSTYRADLRGWRAQGPAHQQTWQDVYTREDELLDQLGQLPTEEDIRTLISALRNATIREWTTGLIVDTVAAVQSRDILEVAKATNSWIATAEEITVRPRKMRHMVAARDQRPS